MTTDKREVAGIIQQVLLHRTHFSAWDKEYRKAMADLAPMSEQRILQNHALVLAFHRLFCSCFQISHDDAAITEFIRETCRKKCESSAVRQVSIVDHFFEQLYQIEEEKLYDCLHIDTDKREIYVNLARAEILLRNKGFSFQVNETMSKAFGQCPGRKKWSYKYRFPFDPNIDATGRPQQRRVWVFDLDWFEKDENGK
jgi:hypothetical protein